MKGTRHPKGRIPQRIPSETMIGIVEYEVRRQSVCTSVSLRRALPDISSDTIHRALAELQRRGKVVKDRNWHARYVYREAVE